MPRLKKPAVAKVEEPKVVAKEEPKKLDTLGMRRIQIQKLSKRVLNGRELNDVHLINGETMLLSDEDLAKQLNI